MTPSCCCLRLVHRSQCHLRLLTQPLLPTRGLAGAPTPAASAGSAGGGGAGAAKKLKGKGVAAISVKKDHEVEKDTRKLATHLCVNYLVDGEYTALKPKEAYPDWLWELRTDMAPFPLETLEPDTEAYWNTVIDARMKDVFRLARIDGWVKAEHVHGENHLRRFYGDVYHEVTAYFESRAAAGGGMGAVQVEDSSSSSSRQLLVNADPIQGLLSGGK